MRERRSAAFSVVICCRACSGYMLPYRLLADVESKLCDAFGVIFDEDANLVHSSIGPGRLSREEDPWRRAERLPQHAPA